MRAPARVQPGLYETKLRRCPRPESFVRASTSASLRFGASRSEPWLIREPVNQVRIPERQLRLSLGGGVGM